MAVGVGARPHETEIKFAWVRRNGETKRQSKAVCKCGWQGPPRESRVAAEDDEFAHISAESEE